jgi:hypothetical protein
MKFINPLMLVVLSFLVACGPATLPKTIEAESRTSLSPTVQPTVPPAEKPVMDMQSSPIATPTKDQVEVAQNSPITTPSPASSANEEPGRETDKANVPNDVVIIFHRGGGFAGVNEQWTIYRDGRITANDGREWQITADQVEQLLIDIEALGFFELNDTYMPLDTCCDRFTYEVTVHKDNKANTVTTIDAAPNVPPELQQIITEINRVLTEGQEG